MTLQEILDRIQDVLNQGVDTESGDLDLLRHDLENFIGNKIVQYLKEKNNMLNQTEYIEGVHCGDKDCYPCATQRHNCDKLNELDKENK